MSSEVMQMKMDIDKLRMETIPKLENDITLLKNTINGMQMSMKALADSQEGILEALDGIEGGKQSVGMEGLNETLKQILNVLTQQAVVAQPTTASAPQQTKAPPKKKTGDSKTEAMPVDLDAADVQWMVKGNNPAEDSDTFAYAFIFDRGESTPKDSLKDLYAACLQFGTIATADGYDVKIGGNKNNLLNRTISKRG